MKKLKKIGLSAILFALTFSVIAFLYQQRVARAAEEESWLRNLDSRQVVMIQAAGTPAGGEFPRLEILIDNQPVQTIQIVDESIRRYFYIHSSPVSIDQIKIAYLNDGVENGQDRNLLVDAVVVDGIRHETESAEVYSTGTYSSDSNCGPGYKQSEWLHCVGYFQFSSQNNSDNVDLQPMPTLEPAPTSEPSQEQNNNLPEAQTPVADQGFTVRHGNIYKNGQEIQLRGVSWFGFESPNHVAHGLWARNWRDMITQIKSTGFNAVRVPFCPPTLRDTGVSSIEYSLNPELQGKTSMQLMDQFLTEMNDQQIYILLDHHTPDCQVITDLWYTGDYSTEQWMADLTSLAQRYQHLEYFVGLDIKNEPKGQATWGTGNESTDWNLAAEKAGRAILDVNPNLLIFVQGVQENPVCSGTIGHWWGGNLESLNCAPINPDYIPANKLVLSPHVYGPDVYPQGYFNDGDFPNNLTSIWDTHFGYLADQGYTIVPGEWGGRFGNNGDPRDAVWQNALANYFQSKDICNSFYWSWNPNSGDTGGILQDDWTNVWSNKVEFLQSYYNQCQ